jgi:hypothetical protein
MRKNTRKTSINKNNIVKQDGYYFYYYIDDEVIDVFHDENSFFHSWLNKYPPNSRFNKEEFIIKSKP